MTLAYSVLLLFLCLALLLLCIYLIVQLIQLPFYLYAQTQGAFYAPIPDEKLEVMVELAQLKPGMKVLDLGSGDGRIVIAAAQTGAEAHGYELNPLLVWQARRNIARAGLADKAFIHQQNFWHASLGEYDVIMLYGISHMMKRLEEKAQRELRPGARLISYFFTFPTWQPSQEKNKVYVYTATTHG